MGKRPLGRLGKGTMERFVMLTHSLLDSEAWRDLSSPAKIIYIYLSKQKKSADCQEHIKFPYSSPDNLFSSRTFSDGIKELISHGFIEYEQKGGLLRRPSVYRLSDRWDRWKKGTPYPYI